MATVRGVPVPVFAAAFSGLHAGEFVPPVLATAVYLTLFWRRSRTLSRQSRPVATWRVIAFAAGVVAVAVVQLPPVDTLADQVLVAHMAQHIVIGDLASLVIVLGLTGPMIQPLLRIRATRPVRRLTHPVVALLLWALDLYVWHLPLLYQLAIRHDLMHAAEHACMLWFGALLWLALIGPMPKPAWFTPGSRLVYVAGIRVIGAILGNVLIWTQTVLYPLYRSSDAARGLNPLSDQNVAGAVMMVEQIVLTILLLAWLFYKFATESEQEQSLLDLAADRGIELPPERAARAAAAGGAERLLADADDSRRAAPEPPSS